jgi:hypothetical protein
MDRDQRQLLRTTAVEVAGWVDRARSVLKNRATVDSAGEDAIRALRSAVVGIRIDEPLEWRVLPLSAGDGQLLGHLARHTQQPRLTVHEAGMLNRLTTDVARDLQDVKVDRRSSAVL